MLNYIILSKQTRIFNFIKPLKGIYSHFKSKTSENAFYKPLRACRINCGATAILFPKLK